MAADYYRSEKRNQHSQSRCGHR